MKIARKAKICFIDILRPTHGITVLNNLHLAQTFELFRWMVQTGDAYRRSRHSIYDIYGLLSCYSIGVNNAVRGFCDCWRRDLWRRFYYAILYQSVDPAITAWRRDYNIGEYGTRIVSISYYLPKWTGGPLNSAGTGQMIDKLLCTTGRLRKAHNRVHPQARSVHSVILEVKPAGWFFRLAYGYKSDSSCWNVIISHQRRDELFVDFLLRTERKMERLVEKGGG